MLEKRQTIRCPRCNTEMVFTRKITPPVDGIIAGLIYRCPNRKGEGGCGTIKELLIILSEEKQQLVNI